MSVALADFLIVVSDPIELKKYRETPEEYLSEFPLTKGDLNALESGNPGWLRLQSSLSEDRMELSSDHPDVRNAIGFAMNNQTIQHTSSSPEPDEDGQEEVIDEEGNLRVVVPMG